jgi:hypothetical protein
MFFKKKTHVGYTDSLVPSPLDERDYLLSSYMPQIQRYPESFPRLFDLDILNQGSEPSCVGFSVAGMKQFNELKEKEYRIFDGSWIYAECKKIDGRPELQGTFLRAGLQILKDVGAKPLNGEDPSIYKISSYARVDDNSFEGLKKAIALYGTVLAGYRGSNDGWRSETVRPAKAGEVGWSHAVFLNGYEKNYLIGQNSWGEKAHNRGIFKIPKDYLPFEAWTILVDKTNEPRDTSDGLTGWVARQYLDGNLRTTVNLNMRENPGLQYRIITTLPKGTQVESLGQPNRMANNLWWTRIKVEN